MVDLFLPLGFCCSLVAHPCTLNPAFQILSCFWSATLPPPCLQFCSLDLKPCESVAELCVLSAPLSGLFAFQVNICHLNLT